MDKEKIITIIIVGLGIVGIVWFSFNGELQNKLLRKTLLNQSECDGEAITYKFISDKDFIIYAEGIPIPYGYSPETKTFKECEEVRIYCGDESNIVNTYDGSPKEGLLPNLTFRAESSNSEIVDCFSDSCIYQKINSMEVCS
jgi:hypothetical protein